MTLAKNGTFGAKKAVYLSEQIPTTCSHNNLKKRLHSYPCSDKLHETTRNECNIPRMFIMLLFEFALVDSFTDLETLTQINTKYKKSNSRFRLEIKKVIAVETEINSKAPK